MTPIELDNYVRCLANLKVGDEVDAESILYDRGYLRTAVVVIKDHNAESTNPIHEFASPKQNRQVGLIVLAIKDRTYKSPWGVDYGSVGSQGRKLITEQMRQRYLQFKTLNSLIRIHRIFKCTQHSK